MKSPQAGLTPSLVALMSVATGLSVACNYYVQPLLETVARTFHLSVNQAGFIVTTAQLGYAAGLLLLVPLGDMLERRGLIVIMSLLAAGGMVITALSPTLPLMLLGTVLTGLFSVVAQILVPLAATLAAPEKRGTVVGLVGAAGALAARQAGTLADKGKARLTTTVGLAIMLCSWGITALGSHSLIALIIGIILLDLAVQAVHITNQSVIYRQMPEARNRLTAGYMTSYFIGGAVGSLVSATAFQHADWYGVCSAGALLTLLNILSWWRGAHNEQATS